LFFTLNISTKNFSPPNGVQAQGPAKYALKIQRFISG